MQSRAHLCVCVCVFVAHTCACVVVVSVETSPLRTQIHSLLSSYPPRMSTLRGVTPTSATCCSHFTLSSSPTRLARACFTQPPSVFLAATQLWKRKVVHGRGSWGQVWPRPRCCCCHGVKRSPPPLLLVGFKRKTKTSI